MPMLMPLADSSTRLLWLLLLLPLLSATSYAAEISPSCDSDPVCQKIAADGMELFSANRYMEAKERFARAYALRADPALLYNLGRTAHKAGHPQEAATYYQLFLDAGAAGDTEQRRKTEQYLSQAQKEAAPPPVTSPLPIKGTASASPEIEIQPPASLPKSSSESPHVPLYRKPWLWAIVGAALAGTAVGLGVGLAARRPDFSNAMDARPFANQ